MAGRYTLDMGGLCLWPELLRILKERSRTSSVFHSEIQARNSLKPCRHVINTQIIVELRGELQTGMTHEPLDHSDGDSGPVETRAEGVTERVRRQEASSQFLRDTGLLKVPIEVLGFHLAGEGTVDSLEGQDQLGTFP